MQRRLALFVLTGLLFYSREAYLTRTHYQQISLEELVTRSDLVLVVTAAQPAQRQLKIPIGKDEKGEQAPAFVRTLQRCQVTAALSPAGAALVGKTIEIDAAHWQSSLELHKLYNLKGIGKSPLYDQYQTLGQLSEDEQKKSPFIVFLQREGKAGFALTAEGAIELVQNRVAIEKLVRAKTGTDETLR